MMLTCFLLVRDEIDIIHRWLMYHVGMFDRVIVTDNGSMDGTREELARWPVEVIDEPAHDYQQAKWMHRMILKQPTGWIVPADADEFFCGNLRNVIENNNANIIKIQSQTYRPTDKDNIFENDPVTRMHYRDAATARVWTKCIFARRDYVEIQMGNHDAEMKRRREIIVPPEAAVIKHYPDRSWAQFRKKYVQGGQAYERNDMPRKVGIHWREKYEIFKNGGNEALKSEWVKCIRDASELVKDPL